MRAIALGEECTRARLAVSVALDGEAEVADFQVAAAHLARCGSCRRFAERVGVISSALRSLRAPRRADETTSTRGAVT